MTSPTPSGAEIIRHWLATSPFVGYLSIGLVALGPGTATLELPYDQSVTTLGTGGAWGRDSHADR
jgi:acyl-coenzyme A thioesterase PaaI-like protein